VTRTVRAVIGVALLAGVAACGQPTAASVTIPIRDNGSGVSGSVTLIEAGPRMTRVVIDVEHGTYPDMPAHIHPGTCADAIPQPKYPLQNVRDGMADSAVPASIRELRTERGTLNLHASNDDLSNVVACADLTAPAGSDPLSP
jgi:hypothetical protein